MTGGLENSDVSPAFRPVSPGAADRKVTVSVIQSPGVTAVSISVENVSVTGPPEGPAEPVLSVVEPMKTSPSTSPFATPPGVLKNWIR